MEPSGVQFSVSAGVIYSLVLFAALVLLIRARLLHKPKRINGYGVEVDFDTKEQAAFEQPVFPARLHFQELPPPDTSRRRRSKNADSPEQKKLWKE